MSPRSTLAEHYHPEEIEPKWQERWQKHGTFSVSSDGSSPKFYVLDMFPYPSGKGLHVGHPRGYVASDIVARFKRMQGYSVLHPMGWDSFGLPTERQAEKEGISPTEVTERNIETFRRQLKMLGLSYDWNREFATSDPDYYKWTQWIFLKLFEAGLAYRAEVPVNWCPALNTVLANEEVQNGLCIDTGDPVERRLMHQWMLRITAYAERLLQDLQLLEWPEGLKEMQRNWIGRTEGARITFPLSERSESFEVYTTRPDTLFGCTYCVLSPEHPLVNTIVTPFQRANVDRYLAEVSRRSERERLAQRTLKTGVHSGSDAICPVNGRRVPVWIADYVLGSYGTGAVFGCPAHDQRDYGFAKTFDLPIVEVVAGGDIAHEAYTGDGEHINSEFLNGLKTKEAIKKIMEWLEQHGHGKSEVQYALRDWLFSRQRYWGEPIPIVYLPDGTAKTLPESALPVLLPGSVPPPAPGDSEPAPLDRAKDWIQTVDPATGLPARRESNTMPQWAGSSWYFLRFADPHNNMAAFGPEAEKRWLPVDLYIGGAEHATLHLLYARFWHKVLYDLGYVSSPEPFLRLFNQGMVLARSFRDERGRYYYPSEVEARDGQFYTREDGRLLQTQIEKMSKSRNNGISPDEVIAQFGADSLRIYEVFMGPLEDGVLWQTSGMAGVRRFLDKVWKLFRRALEENEHKDLPIYTELERALHQTIKKVTEDIEGLQLNTAVSQLMIFVNEAGKHAYLPRQILDILVRLLAPFAPHLSEELWSLLGHTTSISSVSWPGYEESKCISETVTLVIQVNGKVRDRINLPMGSSAEEAEAAARRSASVARYLENHTVKKVFFIENRILNITTL